MRPGPLERIVALGRESPDRPAVEGDGRVVTFGELTDLTGRASLALRSRGAAARAVAGEDPVGVAMAPSAEMVAAVLAIRRAGYPYLPLPIDDMPARRRDAIVADGSPWLVIADAPGRGAEGASPDVATWDDIVHGAASAEPADFPDATADDLGYLIYTSGSTGKPKGVEMRWGALANLIDWQAGDPRLGRPARTALLTPLTFDVSFQEIFGTLVTGGTLVVLDPGLRRDALALARALQAQRIERVFLPFVGLQSLAEAAGSFAVTPAALTDVVTAGEQLRITPEIARFFSRLGHAALHNHYGPAETHVVTAQVLRGDPASWPELPPIGTPIANVEVAVLDAGGAAAPPGVEGELFLGGACLARGYRNLPDETAARFVPDPRPGREGRLYRTGDIGRRSEQGPFEWLGRGDDQVKVRGHRVELGEVESVLSRQEFVRQVAVVPRRSGASQELVAYVVSDAGAVLAGDAATEALDEWRGVWDRTYADDDPGRDPTFDTSGWNSSLTGQPIPENHMREWVESTVARILALRPGRVLEVGCGSGLLLHRIAPHCTHYAGLDYSRRVIDRLAAGLAQAPEPRPPVSLACAAAHELRDCVEEPVDLVVLNSVLQHFPSPAYLLDVLEQAVAVVAARGSVFIGDVTPYAFREAFFTWLEAPDGFADAAHRAAVQDRVQRRLGLDRELTLDPPFFDLLGAAMPRVARVEVQARRGRERNELTDFRYDVVLHLDDAGPPAARRELQWAALDAEGKSADALVRLVRSGVCVRGVPNARTRLPWLRADELAAQDPDGETAVLDPEAVFAAAEAIGFDLEVRPETGCRTFSVGPVGGCAPAVAAGEASGDRRELLQRLAPHASNPLRDRTARVLFPRLRAFAARELPDYMRPAAYVLLDAFPRTSSGKVDRRRLPVPGHRRPELSTSYTAPRNELEKTTERVWRDVLGLDQIGIDDSFFELGGNSAVVVSLAARLGKALGREVPILAIFEHPTVRSFAAQLDLPSAPPAGLARGGRGALVRDAYRQRRSRSVSRGRG